MSKVLMINGSPHENGCTHTALCEVADTLAKHGIETDMVYLGKKPIAGCIACNSCAETGKCVFNDTVNQVASRLDEYAAVVVGSPVYYGGPSGQVCSFLDRLFYSASEHMEGKFAAAVVSCRRGGAASAFDRLNKYFTISNMNVVGSQYWNQVHGKTPEEVRRDEEGLQTMRALGENMAWLILSVEAGKALGVGAPRREERIVTSFIR